MREKVSRLVRRWAREERGQDLIEYAVLAAFVSLVAVLGAVALNSAVGNLYHSTNAKLDKGASFSTDNPIVTGATDCKDKDSTDSVCK